MRAPKGNRPKSQGLSRCRIGAGVSAAQAARDLDVHAKVLRKRIREAEGDPGSAFLGHGNLRPAQQEIERLRCELPHIKAEPDILVDGL